MKIVVYLTKKVFLSLQMELEYRVWIPCFIHIYLWMSVVFLRTMVNVHFGYVFAPQLRNAHMNKETMRWRCEVYNNVATQ